MRWQSITFEIECNYTFYSLQIYHRHAYIPTIEWHVLLMACHLTAWSLRIAGKLVLWRYFNVLKCTHKRYALIIDLYTISNQCFSCNCDFKNCTKIRIGISSRSEYGCDCAGWKHESMSVCDFSCS